MNAARTSRTELGALAGLAVAWTGLGSWMVSHRDLPESDLPALAFGLVLALASIAAHGRTRGAGASVALLVAAPIAALGAFGWGYWRIRHAPEAPSPWTEREALGEWVNAALRTVAPLALAGAALALTSAAALSRAVTGARLHSTIARTIAIVSVGPLALAGVGLTWHPYDWYDWPRFAIGGAATGAMIIALWSRRAPAAERGISLVLVAAAIACLAEVDANDNTFAALGAMCGGPPWPVVLRVERQASDELTYAGLALAAGCFVMGTWRLRRELGWRVPAVLALVITLPLVLAVETLRHAPRSFDREFDPMIARRELGVALPRVVERRLDPGIDRHAPLVVVDESGVRVVGGSPISWSDLEDSMQQKLFASSVLRSRPLWSDEHRVTIAIDGREPVRRLSAALRALGPFLAHAQVLVDASALSDRGPSFAHGRWIAGIGFDVAYGPDHAGERTTATWADEIIEGPYAGQEWPSTTRLTVVRPRAEARVEDLLNGVLGVPRGRWRALAIDVQDASARGSDDG